MRERRRVRRHPVVRPAHRQEAHGPALTSHPGLEQVADERRHAGRGQRVVEELRAVGLEQAVLVRRILAQQGLRLRVPELAGLVVPTVRLRRAIRTRGRPSG